MSTHISLSLLQLRLLLLHPLHKHLPHLILPLLQLHQELLTLGLVGLLQAEHTHTHSRLTCQSYIMSTQVFTSELLTWRVCTLGRCLWIPSPPVCSVCTVHSGECVSALSGPPCWHRSASPSASQSHSDSRSPLTHSDKYEMNSGVSHWADIKYCTFLTDFLQWYYMKLENHLDGDGHSNNMY